MADNLQTSLLKAIDALASYRVQQLDADKTIIATIKQCTNSLTQEYLCSYAGGNMYAYAQGENTYTKDQTVYVLVPKGDFSQKKMILSNVKSASDGEISFITSVSNDYNIIGGDVIFDKSNVYPDGLCSFYKQDSDVLYLYDSDIDKELVVQSDDLSSYIERSQAILIQADFRTELNKEHRNSTSGNYGIQIVAAFKGKDDPDTITYTSYILDTSSMVGNPYQYNTYMTQQALYEIDAENFLYIDSIMFFSEGFVLEDDKVSADLEGDNIFIKNIQIYALQEISAVSGDYMLKMSFPYGSIFKKSENQSPQDIMLQAFGRVTYKVSQDITDSVTFYWAKQDMQIDSTSEYYNSYLGRGWKYLKNKGSNYTLATSMDENLAYENVWICCAIYQEQVILKQEFTLINKSAENLITIESNLGTTFSFDRGIPRLTCLVNGHSSDFDQPDNNYDDTDFRFVWARNDVTNGTIILDKSAEEIQKEIDDMLASGNIDYSAYANLKNKLSQVNGVEFSGINGNIMTYPVSNITASAIFMCSVYRKRIDDKDTEDYIGTGEITLTNEGVADASQYYILISNGDQVFQYSESGVSPASDRYTDPLEIKQLECHFYDQTNLEVNNKTYDVYWKFPLESTMLVQPTENVVINEASGKEEYYQGGPQRPYPLDIVDNYDYQALNNQITCIVRYDGKEYQQDTNFLFVKVGDNGTNGTDIVSKIVVGSPSTAIYEGYDVDKSIYGFQEASLCLETIDDTTRWNFGGQLSQYPIYMRIYRRNEEITSTARTVSYQLTGGNTYSKRLTIDSLTGIVSWSNNDIVNGKYSKQIVQGKATIDQQEYYVAFAIPHVTYTSSSMKKMHLDKYRLLKDVTYNSDGRNPLYNKNQGVFFSNILEDFTATFSVIGGLSDNTSTANIAMSTSRDNDASPTQSPITITGKAGEPCGIYIMPNDIYSGEYTNNIVVATIETATGTATWQIPINMYLNTFGLSSLNAWDGNHIEINEDDNYILAPQIGAGEKDENNRFTGVVMGTMKTYDDDDSTIGLLGFSHGKQSIWLDSETGNAIFGLPEDQASQDNKYQEGRIELIPGGDSKIGQWTIGSRAIYNITKPDPVGDNYEGAEPDVPYRDNPVDGAQISINHDHQGVILNANPGYLSIKGKPLNENNCTIDWDSPNVTIAQGDSLEVEIDPTKESVFSIYRHTNQLKGYEGTWLRYPMVGINESGQFYTNAIKDGESTMGIGFIGAFGVSAAAHEYVGAQFAYGDSNNILKFYQKGETTNGTEDVYFSAGSRVQNEYNKKFKFYAREFEFWTNDKQSTSEESNDFIKMSAGTGGSFEVTHFYNDEHTAFSSIKVPTRGDVLLQSYQGKIHLNATGQNNDIQLDSSNIIGKATTDISLTSAKNTIITATMGNIHSVVDNSSYNYQVLIGGSSSKQRLTFSNSLFYAGNDGNRINLNVSSSNVTPASDITLNSNFDIYTKQGKLLFYTGNASGTIRLIACPKTVSDTSGIDSIAGIARIALTPATDGYSLINMNTGGGQIAIGAKLGTGTDAPHGVQITPALASGFAMLTDYDTRNKQSLVTSYGITINTDSKISRNAVTANGHIMQFCGTSYDGIIQNAAGTVDNYYETYLNMLMIQGANAGNNGLVVKHNAIIGGDMAINKGLSITNSLSVGNQITVNGKTVTAAKIVKWDGYESKIQQVQNSIPSLNGYATQEWVDKTWRPYANRTVSEQFDNLNNGVLKSYGERISKLEQRVTALENK